MKPGTSCRDYIQAGVDSVALSCCPGIRLPWLLEVQAKEKIERAAVASQQTVTDFVVTTLLRASDEALRRNQTIHLTDRDRELFLAALDRNVRPNRALRKAAKRFKRHSP